MLWLDCCDWARTSGSAVLLAVGVEPSLGSNPTYDVALDSQRFLIKQVEQEHAARQIDVVLNWFEELKCRVEPPKNSSNGTRSILVIRRLEV